MKLAIVTILFVLTSYSGSASSSGSEDYSWMESPVRYQLPQEEKLVEAILSVNSAYEHFIEISNITTCLANKVYEIARIALVIGELFGGYLQRHTLLELKDRFGVDDFNEKFSKYAKQLVDAIVEVSEKLD